MHTLMTVKHKIGLQMKKEDVTFLVVAYTLNNRRATAQHGPNKKNA